MSTLLPINHKQPDNLVRLLKSLFALLSQVCSISFSKCVSFLSPGVFHFFDKCVSFCYQEQVKYDIAFAADRSPSERKMMNGGVWLVKERIDNSCHGNRDPPIRR